MSGLSKSKLDETLVMNCFESSKSDAVKELEASSAKNKSNEESSLRFPEIVQIQYRD